MHTRNCLVLTEQIHVIILFLMDIHGGVYLDIKTILKRDGWKDIFKNFENKPNMVYCNFMADFHKDLKNQYIQGIIASYPQNPIFLDLIIDILKNHPPGHTTTNILLTWLELLKKIITLKFLKPGTFESNSRLILLEDHFDLL